ncbi:hypothetical protein CDD82_4387 [Ophiocordyceps australis]|uniref:Uncharacterized protein n=1 Tax=Ophiocordyceps australis TaxID=1399860 RepID=A0A2C5XKL0_9HYPO|nr:hypothetical protein CDD82_4387 [Ophiocordyceps australis]
MSSFLPPLFHFQIFLFPPLPRAPLAAPTSTSTIPSAQPFCRVDLALFRLLSLSSPLSSSLAAWADWLAFSLPSTRLASPSSSTASDHSTTARGLFSFMFRFAFDHSIL